MNVSPSKPAAGVESVHPPAVVRGAVLAVPDVVMRVLEHLRRDVNNRPKRHTTLVRHLQSNILKGAAEVDIQEVIQRFVGRGHLAVAEKGAVTYTLDGKPDA